MTNIYFAGEVSSEALASLEAMGFTVQQATAALSACEGSIDRAVEWLFSRVDDLDTLGLESPANEYVAGK